MRAWHSSWVDRLGFFLGWEADGWWLTAHRHRSLSLISAHRNQYHLDLSLRQPGKQSSFQNIKDYRERLCHVLVWSLPMISAQLPASATSTAHPGVDILAAMQWMNLKLFQLKMWFLSLALQLHLNLLVLQLLTTPHNFLLLKVSNYSKWFWKI